MKWLSCSVYCLLFWTWRIKLLVCKWGLQRWQRLLVFKELWTVLSDTGAVIMGIFISMNNCVVELLFLHPDRIFAEKPIQFFHILFQILIQKKLQCLLCLACKSQGVWMLIVHTDWSWLHVFNPSCLIYLQLSLLLLLGLFTAWKILSLLRWLAQSVLAVQACISP